MLSALGTLVLFVPSTLGEPDNFIVANTLSTPAHIVPEWYFLFAYAILRSVPNKLGGVVGLFSSLLILLLIPFINKNTLKGNAFYPACKLMFWSFALSFFILTLGGSWPVEEPYVTSSRLFSLLYFSYFILHWSLRQARDAIVY